jgi:uncharacterized protein (UPF0333 family)
MFKLLLLLLVVVVVVVVIHMQVQGLDVELTAIASAVNAYAAALAAMPANRQVVVVVVDTMMPSWLVPAHHSCA